ncbi:response regulator transcription factor [Membranihabitans maritimus]|uniref:response regulator transcription factor n=1 Tax=Membranihabitans maritimus TaxID=2904244 RepID=UPI001F268A49|nr:response regulator transcription factor [Membranihabitans maritimus]
MKDTKILLADDHPILLKGLSTFLKEKGYNSVSLAYNGDEALKHIKKNKPEIAILDIEMPKMSGVDVARECQSEKIPTTIIFLSYHQDPGFIALAKTLNIRGFLAKENSIKQIEECIRTVIEGQYFFPLGEYEEVLEEGKLLINSLKKLTLSEKRILSLITQGLNSKNISGELAISLRTVEKHRSNIINKLNSEQKIKNLNQWVLKNKKLILDNLI